MSSSSSSSSSSSDGPHRDRDNKEAEQSPDGRYIRFDEKLGTGAYKEVYRAFDAETGKEVAWNTVNLSRLPEAEIERIKSECDILSQLNHKHIINFYSTWANPSLQQICFATEIVTSGTLKQYTKRVKSIKLKVIKKWCRQILSALDYLHSHHPPIIHRDLKCDNIFINGATSEVRIGDFGLSATRLSSHVASVLGTPEFMAPELYDEDYTEEVDIYAFGMCVLEMTTREYPYEECINAAQIWKKVSKGEKPAVLGRIKDHQVKSFIEMCLSPQDIRLSAHELLQHPFLSFRRSDPSKENWIVPIEPKGSGTMGPIKEVLGASPQAPKPALMSPTHANANKDKDKDKGQQQQMTLPHQSPRVLPTPTVTVPTITTITPPAVMSPTVTPPAGTIMMGGPRGSLNGPMFPIPHNPSLVVDVAASQQASSPSIIPLPVTIPVQLTTLNEMASPVGVPLPSTLTVPTMGHTASPNPSPLGTPMVPDTPSIPTTVSNVVVDIESSSGSVCSVVLNIHFDARRKKQIKFEFDFRHDTSISVGGEMCKALKLPDPERTQMMIATTMETKLEPLRKVFFEEWKAQATPHSAPSALTAGAAAAPQQPSIPPSSLTPSVPSRTAPSNPVAALSAALPGRPTVSKLPTLPELGTIHSQSGTPAISPTSATSKSKQTIFDFNIPSNNNVPVETKPSIVTVSTPSVSATASSPTSISPPEGSSSPSSSICLSPGADPSEVWRAYFKTLAVSVLKSKLKAKGAESIAATCLDKSDLIEALMKLTPMNEAPPVGEPVRSRANSPSRVAATPSAVAPPTQPPPFVRLPSPAPAGLSTGGYNLNITLPPISASAPVSPAMMEDAFSGLFNNSSATMKPTPVDPFEGIESGQSSLPPVAAALSPGQTTPTKPLQPGGLSIGDVNVPSPSILTTTATSPTTPPSANNPPSSTNVTPPKNLTVPSSSDVSLSDLDPLLRSTTDDNDNRPNHLRSPSAFFRQEIMDRPNGATATANSTSNSSAHSNANANANANMGAIPLPNGNASTDPPSRSSSTASNSSSSGSSFSAIRERLSRQHSRSATVHPDFFDAAAAAHHHPPMATLNEKTMGAHGHEYERDRIKQNSTNSVDFSFVAAELEKEKETAKRHHRAASSVAMPNNLSLFMMADKEREREKERKSDVDRSQPQPPPQPHSHSHSLSAEIVGPPSLPKPELPQSHSLSQIEFDLSNTFGSAPQGSASSLHTQPESEEREEENGGKK